MPRLKTVLLLSLAFLLIGGSLAPAADLSAARESLYREYSQKLELLASSCQEHGQPLAAEELRAWLPKRAADRLTLFVLPKDSETVDVGKAESLAWRKRWQALRNAQAEALFALARRAVGEHQPSLAYE